MQHNTDEIVPESTGPAPLQEAVPIQLIDIHLYSVPQEEETHALESMLEVSGETPQPKEWQEEVGPRKSGSKLPLSPLFLVLIALFVLSLIGGVLASFLLLTPTMTVTITPKREQRQTTETVYLVTGNAAGTNDEVKGRILPAITKSQTQIQTTTGTTYQEERKARGTITFYNAALSPQTIATGTLLTGADSTQVVTDQAVTVPAVSYPTLGTALVSAHAVQPGSNGNIKAGDIYGNCCLLNISAVNSPFTEGEEAFTSQSVSKHDLDTVEGYLKTGLTQTVTAALSTQVHNSETLITPPTCQPSITADHQVGDKATQVQVTISLSCIGVTYDTASFQQLMRQAQTHAASRELMEHSRLAGDVHATIQTVTEGSTKGTYQLAVQSTALWVYQFSQARLSDLAASLAGKDTREATQFLLHAPGIQQVSVDQTSTLPSDPQKIHFLVLAQQ